MRGAKDSANAALRKAVRRVSSFASEIKPTNRSRSPKFSGNFNGAARIPYLDRRPIHPDAYAIEQPQQSHRLERYSRNPKWFSRVDATAGVVVIGCYTIRGSAFAACPPRCGRWRLNTEPRRWLYIIAARQIFKPSSCTWCGRSSTTLRVGMVLFAQKKLHDDRNNDERLSSAELTVFLRSADRRHAGHDGLPPGVTRRDEGFSENALGIAAHLHTHGGVADRLSV